MIVLSGVLQWSFIVSLDYKLFTSISGLDMFKSECFVSREDDTRSETPQRMNLNITASTRTNTKHALRTPTLWALEQIDQTHNGNRLT